MIMNTTLERQEDELRAGLRFLVDGCLGGKCVADGSPLFQARIMVPVHRLRWVNSLYRDALISLAAYREVCWKLKSVFNTANDAPVPSGEKGQPC